MGLWHYLLMYSHLHCYEDDCFTLFVKVSIVFRPLVLTKCLHMLHVQTNEFLKDGFHWAGDTKQIEGMDQLFMRKHLQNILMKLLNILFRVLRWFHSRISENIMYNMASNTQSLKFFLIQFCMIESIVWHVLFVNTSWCHDLFFDR